ncbi:exodeoxyribonuclease VII large subunit [Candidatus Nanohalovita haloferacivicina]|uniref:exodeoxyribonuclease VII large subunit n=1 Tax=Candidatus Nanohalovita haloferacivicina TaxID=2978046 RepID=UPI00325FB447|nr:hypothetical protein HBNXNv_0021 [Candidatus Nanohalobia archaeon BNXNv]
MNNYQKYFLTACIGLLTLYLATSIPPEKVEISEVRPSMAGEKVRVTGEVANPAGRNHFFFTLKNREKSIEAVKFDKRPSHAQGEKVTLEGEVSMYRGELQIIVDRIKNR